MQDILEYKGWIIAVVFLLLFLLERFRPAVKTNVRPVLRIIKNLSFWPINIGLSLVVILPISYYATQHTLWERPEWFLGGASIIFNVLILDLFIYFWHRSVHEVQFLWKFHEVHHLDEHLDTTSAIRFHFGEIFFATLVRAVVIIIFAVPFTSVLLFETLVLVFTLFHHSNIMMPLRLERFISKVVVTPSIHWVHHHALRKDTDSNYGTIFSFWDKLFNTRSTTQRSNSMKIGVEGLEDKNFKKLITQPFCKGRPKL